MFTYKEVKKLTCSHTPIFGVDEYLNKNKETIFIEYKRIMKFGSGILKWMNTQIRDYGI